MALKQPVTQVRLTNVAVVRLRHHGYRFEVACYKNKVLNWRTGIEDDLREVLQTNAVFHNVSKGEFAKRDALLAAFNTVDQDSICKVILDKGELQVSEKERQAALAAALQDVITLVIDMTVNVRTGLPLTRTAAASALRQAGFGVKLGAASKAQALKAVVLLQKKLGSDAIARRMMRLQAECAEAHREQVRSFICHQCGGVIEHEVLRGTNEAEEQDTAKPHRQEAEREEEERNKERKGDQRQLRQKAVESVSSGTPQRDPQSEGLAQRQRRLERLLGREGHLGGSAGEKSEEEREERPGKARAERPSRDVDCTEKSRGPCATYSVVFLSPASCYRELDALLHSLGGSLALLAANCIHACPPDLLGNSDKSLPQHADEKDGADSRARERKAGGKLEGENGEASADFDAGCRGRSVVSRRPEDESKKRRNAGRRGRRRCGDSSAEREECRAEDVKSVCDDFGEGQKSRRRKGRNKPRQRDGAVLLESGAQGRERGSWSVGGLALSSPARASSLGNAAEDWEAAAMAWLRRDSYAEPQMRSAAPGGSVVFEGESSEDERTVSGCAARSSTAYRKGETPRIGDVEGRTIDPVEERSERAGALTPRDGRGRRTGAFPADCADFGGESRTAGGARVDSACAGGERAGASEQRVETEKTGERFAGERTKEKSAKALAFACRTCQISFDQAAEYRQHCKSSLHAMNLKRRVKELPPLTEEGWREAQLDEQLALQLEGMVLPEY
ncbi:rRNA metabolism protein, SBDS family protein [Toxoplasma gondii GT1]|uniref:rRNA metabolism protein, SBDS family protein n=3 Tax=Toxoplasma gondii TaxID=5811 RepID=S7UVH7_TOXGG|nr:rRNA metabolism protein, SBDS family protein [Toxoplasma gondii GT1]KAF4642926.1 rRNA metabolism protein, SBDS family protein [Toxoplasma gondii]